MNVGDAINLGRAPPSCAKKIAGNAERTRYAGRKRAETLK